MPKQNNNWEEEFEEWFKEAWSWFGGDFREKDKKEWLRQEVKATIRKTRTQAKLEVLGEVEKIMDKYDIPDVLAIKLEAKITQLKKQYGK